MSTAIPVIVCAKNEARAIGACLESLGAAIAHAEARSDARFSLRVVADDCTDDTESIASTHGVSVLRSRGGKVEAQRAAFDREAPFCIFSDADVVVAADTILGLYEAMSRHPHVRVATPPRVPVPPRRSSLLARAIHLYNLRRGFQRRLTWFNGRLFAIRAWHVPTREELAPRLACVRAIDDDFYRLARGLTVDDIYLSRTIVSAGGPAALMESPRGCVYFRAPETWRGAYRYYRRMRREIERLDRLFPETRDIHLRYGLRQIDRERRAQSPLRERASLTLFQLAVLTFRAAYRFDRAYYRHLSPTPCTEWTPITETKHPIERASIPKG